MTPLDDRTAMTMPAGGATQRGILGLRRSGPVGVAALALIATWWAVWPPIRSPRSSISWADGPHGVVFSPDGRFLAAGGAGITIVPISHEGLPTRGRMMPGSDDLRKEGPKPKGFCGMDFGPPRAWPLIISPDGSTIVASNQGDMAQYPTGDLVLRAWDVATGKLKATLSLPPGGFQPFMLADKFAFADGGRILQASVRIEDRVLRVLRWDARTWQQLPDVVIADAKGYLDRFLDDGSAIAIVKDGESTLVVHELPSGRLRSALVQPEPTPGPSRFGQATFSADGRGLLTVSGRNTLLLWDVPTAKIRAELPPDRVGSWGFAWREMVFAPDGRAAAIVCGDNAVMILDVASARVRALIQGIPDGDPPSIAFSPDGRTLALADAGAFVEGPMTRLRRRVAPHLARVGLAALANSTPGRVPSPGRVRLVSVATGRQSSQFFGTQNNVDQLAFAPTGRELATTGTLHRMDRNVVLGEQATMLWDILPGE